MEKGCSFTGHRTIVPQHQRALTDLVDRAIAYAYGEGCRAFYAGGAIGFDTLAAQRVRIFRDNHSDVRLILLLPCLGQEEHWSWGQRMAYEGLLRAADEVVYVSETYTRDCMRRRNLALVERADILIAYCSRIQSGSGQTLSMAKKKGIDTFNLYFAAEQQSGGIAP